MNASASIPVDKVGCLLIFNSVIVVNALDRVMDACDGLVYDISTTASYLPL